MGSGLRDCGVGRFDTFRLGYRLEIEVEFLYCRFEVELLFFWIVLVFVFTIFIARVRFRIVEVRSFYLGLLIINGKG